MKFLDIITLLKGIKKTPGNVHPLFEQLLDATQDELTKNCLKETVSGYADKKTLYEQILPLCELAYIFEKNGEPKDHAAKLATIFRDETAVINYLIKFGKGSKHNFLLHDACLFTLPDTNQCHFEFWKKIANTGDNMLNKNFLNMLVHAEAIEKIIHTAPKNKIDHAAVLETEQALSAIHSKYVSTKCRQAALLSEQKKKSVLEP